MALLQPLLALLLLPLCTGTTSEQMPSQAVANPFAQLFGGLLGLGLAGAISEAAEEAMHDLKQNEPAAAAESSAAPLLQLQQLQQRPQNSAPDVSQGQSEPSLGQILSAVMGGSPPSFSARAPAAPAAPVAQPQAQPEASLTVSELVRALAEDEGASAQDRALEDGERAKLQQMAAELVRVLEEEKEEEKEQKETPAQQPAMPEEAPPQKEAPSNELDKLMQAQANDAKQIGLLNAMLQGAAKSSSQNPLGMMPFPFPGMGGPTGSPLLQLPGLEFLSQMPGMPGMPGLDSAPPKAPITMNIPVKVVSGDLERVTDSPVASRIAKDLVKLGTALL